MQGRVNLTITELPETRLQDNPSPAEIEKALQKEALDILTRLEPKSRLMVLCIEGKEMDSEAFSLYMAEQALHGCSHCTFVIGGSFGIHDSVKEKAHYKLSFSKMTLPHALARVVLLEQLYRADSIQRKEKYHK